MANATMSAIEPIYTHQPPKNAILSSNDAIRAEAKREEVAVAVTNTVILESILGIAIVAVVLTLIEVLSIIYIVFPKIKNEIKTMLQRQSSESMRPLKPLIQTLATREAGFTERANNYIQIVAWAFAFLLALVCLLLSYLINNEYRLQGKLGAQRYTFYKIVFWSFVTIGGIAVFQGFGCIVIGQDSSFCSKDSFAVVSTEWKQNDNFSQIALSTGICDDVADIESIPNQDFDKVLSLYLAEQIANQQISNQQDSDPSTVFQELASNDAQDMLNTLSRLRSSTGVQERT